MLRLILFQYIISESFEIPFEENHQKMKPSTNPSTKYTNIIAYLLLYSFSSVANYVKNNICLTQENCYFL